MIWQRRSTKSPVFRALVVMLVALVIFRPVKVSAENILVEGMRGQAAHDRLEELFKFIFDNARKGLPAQMSRIVFVVNPQTGDMGIAQGAHALAADGLNATKGYVRGFIQVDKAGTFFMNFEGLEGFNNPIAAEASFVNQWRNNLANKAKNYVESLLTPESGTIPISKLPLVRRADWNRLDVQARGQSLSIDWSKKDLLKGILVTIGAILSGISGGTQEAEDARREGREPSKMRAVLLGWEAYFLGLVPAEARKEFRALLAAAMEEMSGPPGDIDELLRARAPKLLAALEQDLADSRKTLEEAQQKADEGDQKMEPVREAALRLQALLDRLEEEKPNLDRIREVCKTNRERRMRADELVAELTTAMNNVGEAGREIETSSKKTCDTVDNLDDTSDAGQFQRAKLEADEDLNKAKKTLDDQLQPSVTDAKRVWKELEGVAQQLEDDAGLLEVLSDSIDPTDVVNRAKDIDLSDCETAAEPLKSAADLSTAIEGHLLHLKQGADLLGRILPERAMNLNVERLGIEQTYSSLETRIDNLNTEQEKSCEEAKKQQTETIPQLAADVQQELEKACPDPVQPIDLADLRTEVNGLEERKSEGERSVERARRCAGDLDKFDPFDRLTRQAANAANNCDYTEALRLARKAAELKPQHPWVTRNLPKLIELQKRQVGSRNMMQNIFADAAPEPTLTAWGPTLGAVKNVKAMAPTCEYGAIDSTVSEAIQRASKASASGPHHVFVLTNASSGLYVGTEASLQGRTRCSFEGGGIDCQPSDVVTYQKLLGPFPTLLEAQLALCSHITERKIFPLGIGLKGRWQGSDTWYGLWNGGVRADCPEQSAAPPAAAPDIATLPTKDFAGAGMQEYFTQAKALLQRRDLPGALSQFQKANQLEPDSAAVHHNLSLLYEAQDQINPAIRHAQDYLRLAPGAYDRADVEARVASLRDELQRNPRAQFDPAECRDLYNWARKEQRTAQSSKDVGRRQAIMELMIAAQKGDCEKARELEAQYKERYR